MKSGSLPKHSWSDLAAACIKRFFIGTTTGLPPWKRVTFTLTDRGAMDWNHFSTISAISLGSWFGTRRMEIFAFATAGRTVLAPTPVNPPQIPFTSNEGLAQDLSRGDYGSSPQSSPTLSFAIYSS